MPEVEGSALSIWGTDDCQVWISLLEGYSQVIAARGSERLVNLDDWYRNSLPGLIAERAEPCIYPDELQGVVAWKMTRGKWRERNRHLVGQNTPEQVIEASRQAFRAVPQPAAPGQSAGGEGTAEHDKPIKILSALSGVGPATASAVMAAYAPQLYPFFDELVAEQIEGLGPVAFTAGYYRTYASELRKKASALNSACVSQGREQVWTAHDVAQALWAAAAGSSGKAVGTDTE